MARISRRHLQREMKKKKKCSFPSIFTSHFWPQTVVVVFEQVVQEEGDVSGGRLASGVVAAIALVRTMMLLLLRMLRRMRFSRSIGAA